MKATNLDRRTTEVGRPALGFSTLVGRNPLFARAGDGVLGEAADKIFQESPFAFS